MVGAGWRIPDSSLGHLRNSCISLLSNSSLGLILKIDKQIVYQALGKVNLLLLCSSTYDF